MWNFSYMTQFGIGSKFRNYVSNLVNKYVTIVFDCHWKQVLCLTKGIIFFFIFSNKNSSCYQGTEVVEGLSLDVSARKDVIVSIESFAKMINLRLLKINSVRFTIGCYEKFFKQVRWFCWHRCPLKVLPPNLDLDNLIVLDMRFSNVKEVWKKTKVIKFTLQHQ